MSTTAVQLELLKEDERAAYVKRGCPRCDQEQSIAMLVSRLTEERGTSNIQRLHDVVFQAIQAAYAKLSKELSTQNGEYHVSPQRLAKLLQEYTKPLVNEEAIRNYYKVICGE